MTNSTRALAFVLASAVLAVPAVAQMAEPPQPNASSSRPTKGTASRLGSSNEEAKEQTSTAGRKFDISDKARAAIVELQQAVDAKDAAAIPAKLAAAQMVAKKPDEKFLVATNQTKAAMNAGDLAGMQAGIEAMQASGSATNSDVVPLYVNLGKRYFDAKQHDLAATVLDRVVALDANHSAALKLLAVTRDAQGRKAEAVQLMQRSMAATKAAGGVVAENEYRFAVGIAHANKLPAANQVARDWVSAYPTSKNWHDALRVYRDLNNPQGEAFIDHMRLARAAGGLSTAPEYYNFASELFEAGEVAEAKAVLAEAQTKGVDVNTPEFKDLASRLTKIPTRAEIDASAKTAIAGASAKAAIDAGDAYFGIGAYAEAASLYRAALAKSGVDANLVNLRLGAALARAGDKAGATAALNAVAGSHAETAKYWQVWLSQRA